MEINTKDYSYQEYLKLYNKARYRKSKLIIHGICKECGKAFTKSRVSEEGYYFCANCMSKHTKVNKYGSIENAEKLRLEKTRISNLEKYGCECPFQSETVKEKIKDTLTKKYGNGKKIENPSQIKEIKEKIKKTNLEKYGSEYYLASEDRKNKTKIVSLEKYGCESPNSSDIVKKHKKESYLKHYGVDNPNKVQEVREKIIDTCINKYGRIWNVYKYYYDGLRFDSSWEVKLYIFLKDKNYEFIYHPIDKIKDYYVDGKKHYYEPDFLINGELYEIKGSHFFNDNGELIDIYKDRKVLSEKQKAMEGVHILTENSELLKLAFEYFNTLNINIKELKKKI